MDLYPNCSPFKWRIFRRLCYGKGRGVHSPKAFSMVNTLLFPQGTYYAYNAMPNLFENPVYQLIYRIIVRCRLHSVVLLNVDNCIAEIASLANPNVCLYDHLPPNIENTLLVLDDIPKSGILDVYSTTYLLILTSNRATYRMMKWVRSLNDCLILDLYEAVLITGIEPIKNKNNSINYIYRTTL